MFITFEGLDASGKSTLLEKVEEELMGMGKKVNRINKESINYDELPYVSEKIEYLNHIIYKCNKDDDLTEIPTEAWVFLNASWFSIVGNSYIKDDAINISDSWIYKRIARFSLLPQFKDGSVEALYKHIRKPDITFFVNIGPEETWLRRERHSRKDFGFLNMDYDICTKERFLKYQNEIYINLKLYAHKYNWIELDGTQNIQILSKQVMETLREII